MGMMDLGMFGYLVSRPNTHIHFRSSFLLRIGSGLGVQNVRLLPSTNLAETYLINPLGCGNPNTTDIRFPVLGKPCPESRGLFFNHHKSTTYEEWKIFNISEYAALGNYGIREHYAQFGWDDVHFGYPKAAGGWDGPVANSNIIGEITNTTFFWVGVFGLDPRPTNLTDPDGTNNPQKSLLDRLKDNSAIPSSSWAYTAGSMYCKFLSINLSLLRLKKHFNIPNSGWWWLSGISHSRRLRCKSYQEK
jgi:hypothetical protein